MRGHAHGDSPGRHVGRHGERSALGSVSGHAAHGASVARLAKRRHVGREMARPEGFEPPTNGFGSHYSIRLSYGRTGRAF